MSQISTPSRLVGGLPLPPRQRPVPRPSGATDAKPSATGLKIAAGVTGAVAVVGAIRRAVAERGFS